MIFFAPFFALRRGSNVIILLVLIAASAGLMLTMPVAGNFVYVAAQFTVILFLLLLSIGAYIFSRQWLPKIAALGVAILTIGTPEVAYWGRQVRPEIPTYAMAMFSMLAICAYLRRNAPAYLYLAVLFFLAALYTKYQIAYMVIPAVVAVVMARGWRIVLDRHVITAVIGGLLLALPAAYLALGRGNASIAGDIGITNWRAWTAYPSFLPHQLGWITVFFAVLGAVFSLVRRPKTVEPWFIGMMVAWVISGYLFFSLLNPKAPRYDLPVLFPLISLAAFGVWMQFRTDVFRQGSILAIALLTYAYSLIAVTPPLGAANGRAISAYVLEKDN